MRDFLPDHYTFMRDFLLDRYTFMRDFSLFLPFDSLLKLLWISRMRRYQVVFAVVVFSEEGGAK